MVASYTQLLAKRYSGRLDEKAQKYIDYAVDGAKRMQTLINDLLDYSRIGTRGKKFTEVDCQDVVDRALEIMRENVTQCEAVISVGEMPEVIGDENQLVQVFQNLIGNALKYRSGEKPLVTISAKKKDLYWEFRVEDNGIGIARQYHERIFTIFQRLHGRTEYSGSGIGLSIVKKIIERHNGRIRVESEEGKGAAFIFTLLSVRKR
jgi:light-regulated signal transduction histidine kinase (bacteriophytochrome)